MKIIVKDSLTFEYCNSIGIRKEKEAVKIDQIGWIKEMQNENPASAHLDADP